jgi:hypothetical protein
MRGTLATKNINRRRKTRKLLETGASAYGDAGAYRESGTRVPTRWVKMIAGVFLLPVAAVFTETFFGCFSRETLRHSFWRTEEFIFFSLGAAIWLAMFFAFPRPIRIYVFGHELTHAVWVWLMGGRVSKFKVGADGGHIITDTHNFWIALAPYFYPIYSMLLLAVYGALSLWMDLAPYNHWFFALLGVTWCFHITFTVWMIPKGQTDLTYHGTFFSLVVIYLMNLAVLALMLIVASSHTTFLSFGRELLANAADLAAWMTQVVRAVWS